MATGVLTTGAMPTQAELRSFARVASHLLAEHPTPALGSRTVKRRAGVGLQHLDHRDYAPGDEVRHIDWRQTARLQRPIVRQFEAETSGDWFLMLDASSSMAVGNGGSGEPPFGQPRPCRTRCSKSGTGSQSSPLRRT